MPRVHKITHYVSLQIRDFAVCFPPNFYLDLLPTKAPEGDVMVTLRAVRVPAVPYLNFRASILRELPEVSAGSSSGLHIPDYAELVQMFSTPNVLIFDFIKPILLYCSICDW